MNRTEHPTTAAIVTDVHYRMSLALIRDLAEAGVTVITCEKERHKSAASPALGRYSRHCSRHIWLPEENYAQALYELCQQIGAEFRCKPALLPVGAATLALLAGHRQCFSQVAGLLIPTPEQLDLLNDKNAVSHLARQLGVPVPALRCPQEGGFRAEDCPCVVKPLCGEKLGLSAPERYGIAHTPQEAQRLYDHFLALAGEPPLAQQYLPGAGMGCSVLAAEGRILAAIAHRRLREYPVSGGPSCCCVSVDPAPLLPWVQKLVEATGYTGLAMFEFKEDCQGRPHLLEVNPRIWGTFPLTRITESGIPLSWFTAAWNAGNPQSQLPMPQCRAAAGKKMIFCASDLMSAVGYAKKGQPGKSLQVLVDLLHPGVRDGLLEWRDLSPALVYFRSLLGKEAR